MHYRNLDSSAKIVALACLRRQQPTESLQAMLTCRFHQLCIKASNLRQLKYRSASKTPCSSFMPSAALEKVYMLERNPPQPSPAMTLHMQQDKVAALRDQQQSTDLKLLLAESLCSNVLCRISGHHGGRESSSNMVTAEPGQLANSPLKCSEVQIIPASQLPSPWLIHPPVAVPGGGGEVGPAHAYHTQPQIAHCLVAGCSAPVMCRWACQTWPADKNSTALL